MRKYLYTSFLLALFVLGGALPARAQHLTVFTGNDPPFYQDSKIFYTDVWNSTYTKCQFVVHADSLTAMTGADFTALTFYSEFGYVPYTSGSEVDIYLAEVDFDEYTYSNITWVPKSDATVVYSGQISIKFADSCSLLTIVFDTPYPYNGGNLMVGIENTTTDAADTDPHFLICNVTKDYKDVVAVGYGNTSQTSFFAPKVTFTYGNSMNTIIGSLTNYDESVPTNCGYKKSVAQFIYKPGELDAPALDINGITFYHTDTPDLGGGSEESDRSWDIYLTHTSTNDYGSGSPRGSACRTTTWSSRAPSACPPPAARPR